MDTALASPPTARHTFANSDSRNVLRHAFCLAALFFCLAGLGAVHGQAGLGERWEWRNPLPQGSELNALAESEGRLIAVGSAGTVLTTTDGMSWTPRVSGTRNYLRAVAASGATVVAVGRDGDIVTSTDGGLTWALRSSSAMSWNTVIHGGGVWLAAGRIASEPYTGTVMTSPDGLTWTAVTVPNTSSTAYSAFTCAVWTGLRFVLGSGWNVDGNERLATSEDGITWTPRAARFSSVQGLAWTGSRVVAVGRDYNNNAEIFISPDGITWKDALTPEAGSPIISGVVWTGAQLLAWGDYFGGAYTSPTGETWTRRVLSPNYFNPTAAAGAGTTLLLGGQSGGMAHSPDSGVTWNPVSSGVEGNLNAITRFAGRWVAVGEGGSLTSSADGVTWTPTSSGNISGLRGLAWHNGLWVAVGGSILTSTDGVAWTDRIPNFSGSSVIHTGSQWVATADGEVLTSPDGITWQNRSVGQENQAVAWNGSRLIVVGGIEDGEEDSSARVDLSDDGGVTWTTQPLGAGFFRGFLRGIVWTGSQFVIVGRGGRIFTSPTGDAGT
ncbi:MAG: hypothetical protein ACR2OZ_00960 [Verrucomicrobiales bacterium]